MKANYQAFIALALSVLDDFFFFALRGFCSINFFTAAQLQVFYSVKPLYMYIYSLLLHVDHPFNFFVSVKIFFLYLNSPSPCDLSAKKKKEKKRREKKQC